MPTLKKVNTRSEFKRLKKKFKMSASADQSDEEGLVRSPENIDSDDATNDSLDIKPPQAKNDYRTSKKSKHKRHHERRDKDHYYSREKDDRREQRRDYRDKYDYQDYKRESRDYLSDRRKSEQSRSRRSSQDDSAKYDYERREEDLRNRLIERRQQKEAHGSSSRRDDYDRKEKNYDDYDKRHHRHRPIDFEAEARRKKFLEADRDEMKRKEKARQELEARREQHRSKETKSREVSLSPERKKKRYSEEEKEQDVVMLSSERSEHEEVNSDIESRSTKSKESEEFEISPVERLEKSDRRDRSRSSSHYTRSHSRDSRSRSRSTHSRSRSHSESSTGSSDSAHSGESSKSSESSHDEEKSPHKNETKEASPKVVDVSKKENESLKIDDDDEELLPPYFPALQGCRSVEEFQCLNRIEEGTYGVVYRAKDKRTDEVVALKRLKMEKEKEGFPITSLREINTLLKGQHPNIVTVREIVVGSNMDKIFIVMDYVEHDLKSLMETMKHKKQVFLPGEVKCLIQQLMRAVTHLHDNWILHRDLKTSNLLLSHKGILKVGDFGLAREYGSPLKEYTSIVVTLWYRAPELLLGCREYSTSIDVWSCGCIFAELLAMTPLFPGKSEVDQLNRIFKDLGTPNERVWPGYDQLPLVKKMTFTDYPISQLRKKFANFTSELGLSLLQGLLTYDPKQRLTAEASLKSNYFKELPLPIDPSMFPT